MVVALLIAAKLLVTMESQTIDPFDNPKGTIVVERNEGESIEEFRLGGELIQPTLEKEEKEGEVIRSHFRFETPYEKEGPNFLPAMTVIVGKEKLRAKPQAYSVKLGIPEGGLVLKAFVYGNPPFYPGERLEFVYKIFFRGSIELTEEELPLLKAEGFKKIGELEVKDSTFSGYQLRTIKQRVETVAPGDFSFPESVMKGILNGKEEVQTLVDPFSIVVLAFPKEEVPISFTGALGLWKIESKLLSEPKTPAGENILLQITLKGEGNLDELSLPPLFCLPGFSGFFTPTGNPIVSKTGKGEKIFYVELIPTTPETKRIPPVLFSFFDTAYQTIASSAIPIEVTGAPSLEPVPDYSFPSSHLDWKEIASRSMPPAPIPVKIPEKRTIWPWLLLLLGAQYALREGYVKWRERQNKRQALQEAGKYPIEDPRFVENLRLGLQGTETGDLFSLLDYAKFGGGSLNRKEILERAWRLIS